LDSFSVTSGTIAGREHVRLSRNNQDGIGIAVDGEVIAAVVTDGCSEGRASEVGAKLAASWLAEWAPLYVRALERDPRRFVPALADGLLRQLEPFVRSMTAKPGIDPAIVGDFFLFTFLMLVITEVRTTVFGVGDGLFSIDGRTTILDSGADNAPEYLAYRLLGRELEPTIHFDAPTIEVPSAIIATDGARELTLDEFFREPKYLENPTLLHKRLNALGAVQRRLFDDTSVVLVRRR
jgi:hypothetical protein